MKLREFYKEPDITAVMRNRRLTWLGHMVIKEEIKRVWKEGPEAPRPISRLRTR